MDHFDTINTVGIKKETALQLALQSETSRDFSPTINNISVGLSSGTSGNKGLFLTSPTERAAWVGAVLDRVIGFSLKKRKVAFFLRANNQLYESVKSNLLRFHFFDIKTPTSEHLSQLKEMKADILVAQPSVLFTIAHLYQKQKITSSFHKVISVAEVLEDDQKKFFEQVFQCRVEQVYQCTEGFLAHTCKQGNLHFNEDWLTIEKQYLEKDRTRFHPIITDHLRTSQPVIRYELNDIIQEGAPCSCGLKSTVIRKIEGRSDDVFSFEKDGKEILIYPDFIRRIIITASDIITNYVISQVDNNTVNVYVEVNEEEHMKQALNEASEALSELFHSLGADGIDITNADYKHNPMNKFKRIRNDYKKSL